MPPEIAIIGHPNEGKSSVLSTLAEDDSVRISPYPGETTVCRTFPMVIDQREILRFTDTPGFQNPGRVLARLKSLEGSSEARLRALLDYCGKTAGLTEDHELLTPLARGAAIIYVVNGARPVRAVDRDEMEIIRLLGKPRMAVINSKADDRAHLGGWKDELGLHFNSIRVFNAHHATYGERIGLLEALKAIDQDWQQVMAEVIDTVKKDWDNRSRTTAHLIVTLLDDCLSLQLSERVDQGADHDRTREALAGRYAGRIAELEKRTQEGIRALFHHNLYDYRLPPYSILHEEIFSEKSWQFMGLSNRQFILLGSLGGGALGAGVDVAALGHGLGLFTILGTIGGALGALGSRKHLDYQASLLGFKISGAQLTLGPAESISLLFVLLNRALHFYRHMANWSHGRRDHPRAGALPEAETVNYTRDWQAERLRNCQQFFTTLERPEADRHRAAAARLEETLVSSLSEISSAR